jgi:uncharacterized membrane protein
MTNADSLPGHVEASIPEHVETSIQTIVKLHADHRQRATPFQRGIEGITDQLGRPACLGFLAFVIIVWIAANLVMLWLGSSAVDPPSFNWLQTILALMALSMTLLIVATQRRADELATIREQLTLQMALIAEQKTAKIIELIEEMRRDIPWTKDRIDQEARAMAAPADFSAVITAIEPLTSGAQADTKRK